jgi:hypothetical protein
VPWQAHAGAAGAAIPISRMPVRRDLRVSPLRRERGNIALHC